MDNLIKFSKNMESAFKVQRIVWPAVGIIGVLFGLICVLRSYTFSENQSNQIFILDEGRSLVGFRAAGQATVELEVIDHVKTFHMLFFNLAPSAESINANKEAALLLADRSAAQYWDDLQEDGYFNRLISVNACQNIILDANSITVDKSVYPYKVHTKGKIMVIRSSVMSLYNFESTCGVFKTQRSVSNPHGMMIENFFVNDFSEEARRPR